MFKKLIFALLACLFLASQALASQVNSTIINAALIDDDPLLTTSDTAYLQDYKKVAFFVNYDETQNNKTVSGITTMQLSYDGTNWITGYFYDLAGGTTLQTSETITSDNWYYLWLSPDLEIPFARVIVSGVNTDTDDTILLNVYLVGEK